MEQSPTKTLSLNGHARINVSDSLDLMTRFVLEEQGDWFEDELPFLRKFLKKGMQVIDIGANIGCYALSIAAAISVQNTSNGTRQNKLNGHVWAFEPCADTFELLQSSRDLNKFTHLSLVQAGLSNQAGQATLYRSQNSELNSLHSRPNRNYLEETIDLKTLDQCYEEFNWQTLDFIKLDAEGEECNILLGGQHTFKTLSPLVMFELKHGNDIHHDLISDFEKMNYRCYTLNKALDLLLPFNPKDIDGFQLNLFACKDDTAIKLEENNLLSRSRPNIKQSLTLSESIEKRYAMAMAEYAVSTDNTREELKKGQSKLTRLEHWQHAFHLLESICKEDPSQLEASSAYTRLALLLGKRQKAVSMLRQLLKLTNANSHYCSKINASEIQLLSPLENYDEANHKWQLETDPVIKEQSSVWLRAAVLEGYIKYHAFSCYFSGEHALPMLSELNATIFSSKNMQDRERVIRRRY